MNIIIIAELWGESKGISSLRPMKITKYLLRLGHSVTVICGSYVKDTPNPGHDLESLRAMPGYSERPIFDNSWTFKLFRKQQEAREDLYEGVRQALAGEGRNLSPVLRKLMGFLYRRLYLPLKRLDSARVALRQLLREGVDEPDLIFSSYEPIQVHLLAERLRRRFPSARWHADFRDSIPHFSDPLLFYRLNDRCQKRICQMADTVSFVSKGLLERFSCYGLDNMHVLHSGFDAEDLQSSIRSAYRLSGMRFTYTGSLYPGLSDLTPFFRALGENISEGRIESRDVVIAYAGQHPCEFERQASILCGKVALDVRGFVPRQEAVAMQRSSDILLHASFNTNMITGMLTGKIYEYWLASVPIITIIDGAAPHSELADMIRCSRTGFVYEAVNAENDFPKLKEYIFMQYSSKVRDGMPAHNPDAQYISQFDYRIIVSRLLELSLGVSRDAARASS